ncbi:MAG: hypothetical protein DRI94_06540 [Bacteroidetes bacterium]|nr:MAG: hypothetical protein DRI94_06540 [Bacteroidota bacterium]
MENVYFSLAENAFWSGIAAVGFGILFNVPRKVVIPILILGLAAGFVKFLFLNYDFNIVIATFFASLFVGIFSIPFAYKIHKPIVVLGIPSIIPMIPGYFAYKTILGMRMFTFFGEDEINRNIALNSIFSNGFTTLFILLAITIGVASPLLILGKDFAMKLKD